MIRITINHPSLINGFKIVGHADAGSYGHDIVCAAVSVLSITTVNGILALTNVKPVIKKNSSAGGFLEIKIPLIRDSVQRLKVQTLLQSFELGIKNIAKDYVKHIDLKIIHNR